MVQDMQHYSRGQWSQIIKRAKLAKFTYDPAWKCLICGFRDCDHTYEENEAVAAEAKRRSEVAFVS
jgi:hypothetical protein